MCVKYSYFCKAVQLFIGHNDTSVILNFLQEALINLNRLYAVRK